MSNNGSVSIELDNGGKADVHLWPHGNVTAINIVNRDAKRESWNFWVMQDETGKAVSPTALDNDALKSVFNFLKDNKAITPDAFLNPDFMKGRLAMEFGGKTHTLVHAPDAVTQAPVDAGKLGNKDFWKWPTYNQ